MSLAVERVELWNGRPIDGGALLAILPVTQCRTINQLEGFVWNDRNILALPFDWDKIGASVQLIPERIIRLRYVGGTFKDFVIDDVDDSSEGDRRIIVNGRGAIFDLATRNEYVYQASGGVISYTVKKQDTVANLLTFGLGFGPGYVIGTITPSNTIEVTVTNATPLAWCIAVAEEVARVTGIEYELWAEWDVGSGNYKIHFGTRNAAAVVPDIRFGKNLLGVQRKISGKMYASRIIPEDPVGRGAGDNRWYVQGVPDGTHIDIEDINGNGQPLLFDVSLNNTHWIVDEANTKHAITGGLILSTTRARLTMASSAGISVGHWVRISDTSSGDEVRYIDNISGTGFVGVKALPVRMLTPGVTNLMKNPDVALGSPNPTDWTKSGGGTFSFDTAPDNWRYGGRSIKLLTASLTFDQTKIVEVPATGVYFANYALLFKIDPSGTPGTSQFGAFYGGSLIANFPIDMNLYADGQFHLLYGSTLMASGTRTIQLSCVMGRVMWMDAAMLYVSQGSAVDLPFFKGSGGAQNWLDSLVYLRKHPIGGDVFYKVAVLDLSRHDSVKWPYDELVEGGTVKVTDEVLGIAPSPRVLMTDRDELKRILVQMELSTVGRTLTTSLAASAR